MPATIDEVKPDQQGALEGMYRAYSGLILQVAYRITGRMSDAEDALQTVFLRLAGRMGQQEPENMEAYFRRAATNAALDILRSRNSRGEIATDDEDGDFLETVGSRRSADESPEIRDALRQALARLSPRAAEMFALRYIEGYDNQEIARMLGTSAAVIAVLLYRTRSQLKGELRAFMRGRK